MNKKTKAKILEILDESQRRCNAAERCIEEGDIEAGYRLLTTIDDEIGKARLRLFKKLHPAIRKTVEPPL